jgi:hypothetical protein
MISSFSTHGYRDPSYPSPSDFASSIHFYNEPLIRRDLEDVIVKFKRALPGVTDAILTTACYAPTEMLIITVTGDVVLC